MLQDLLKPHENAEELVRKEFGGQMDELILIIEDSISKNKLFQYQGSEFRNRMMSFAANFLAKKFDNESEFLSFINSVLKELNNEKKEKKMDSSEIAIISFIFGAVTTLIWMKNFSKVIMNERMEKNKK